jgi:predicted TIM-barrel fold metal-dependent hydrolase
MAAPGDPHDACFAGPYADALAAAGGELAFFDAHTHLGENDPDGRRASAEEIIAGLDRAGHARALIFAMQELGGYAAANAASIDAARLSEGRLLALARLDPNRGEDALEEGARCLAAGAVGFKLHPRSDAFAMPHPVVEAIVALAAEHRAPVLFHAGRGFPGLGEEVAQMAARHPGARLILAHAGISDLGHLSEVVAEAPNLFFDTSWWQVSDLLTLFTAVPPGRILYGSDMPYGPARFAALAFLRCAQAVGSSADALRAMAGGQLERIVAGDEPADVGPAPEAGVLGARDLASERAVAYLTAAVQISFRGGDPAEPLSLARLALRPARNDAMARADALVAAAQDALAGHPGLREPVTYPALAAQVLLGTARD